MSNVFNEGKDWNYTIRVIFQENGSTYDIVIHEFVYEDLWVVNLKVFFLHFFFWLFQVFYWKANLVLLDHIFKNHFDSQNLFSVYPL